MKKKSLILNLPNISSLTDSDEPIYESFFRHNSRHDPFIYGNSWAYITQAGRYNPLKFYDNQTLITITNSRIPEGPLRLIQPMGAEIPKKISLLCREIRSISRQPIIIGKLKYNNFNILKSLGFKDPKWHPNILEELPDDIYPQPICKLQNYFNNGDICLQGSNLAKLRGKISRFKKNKINFSFECLSEEKNGDAITALSAWKDFFVKRYKKKGYVLPSENSYYLDPYLSLIRKLTSKIDNYNYFGLIGYIDNLPVGVSLLARISDVSVAQYMNICSNYYKGLSEFLALHTFKEAFSAGYKYVNMGGSETSSLFKYNKKFGPESYEQDYYLIF